MRVLFLLYGDPAGEAALTGAQRMAIVEEHLAFRRRLAQAGRLIVGEALSGDVRTVHPGQDLTTDGPFAETTEQLGSAYVVDCADLDEAERLAEEIPRSPGLVVEIRPTIGS